MSDLYSVLESMDGERFELIAPQEERCRLSTAESSLEARRWYWKNIQRCEERFAPNGYVYSKGGRIVAWLKMEKQSAPALEGAGARLRQRADSYREQNSL